MAASNMKCLGNPVDPALWLTAVVLLVPAVLTFVIESEDAARTNFNYNVDPTDPFGVRNWQQSYSELCTGQRQSPVDVNTRFVRYNPALTCPVINYRSPRVTGTLTNNGHAIVFKPSSTLTLTLSNAPYRSDQYVINNVHFHYGGQYTRGGGTQRAGVGSLYPGSEHTLNGQRYDGEIHLVYKNVNYEAMDRSVYSEEDGIVVTAVFVQVLPDAEVQDLRFSRFLEHNLQFVHNINSSRRIYMDISMLFVPGCGYYSYPGSLTTPFCGESVRWILFTDTIKVTQSAWYRFTACQSRGGYVSMYGNYRQLQSLNGRVVETNIPPATPGPAQYQYGTTAEPW